MKITAILILSFLTCTSYSQNLEKKQSDIGAFIGVGNTNLLDEYISPSDYTGVPFTYGLFWSELSAEKETGVNFKYSVINDLKNMNSRADTYDFLLDYRILYNIYEGKFLEKPLRVYLGPDFGIYMHYREQKVADNSKALSIASTLAAGAEGSAVSIISKKITAAGHLSLALLSFTARTPSLKDTGNLPTPIALLTLPTIIDLRFSVSARYYITQRITVQIGYGNKFILIDKWDKFRMINDNLILQFGMDF